jgi:ABC-type maltose transport system permease subunit
MEQQRITFDTFVRGLIGVIIIVFIIFQKYFTKGITMGAVKG